LGVKKKKKKKKKSRDQGKCKARASVRGSGKSGPYKRKERIGNGKDIGGEGLMKSGKFGGTEPLKPTDFVTPRREGKTNT